MNQKRAAVFFLVILILSTTAIFLNQTFATTSSEQKQKAETLYMILENSNTTIPSAFSRLDSQNLTAPNAQTTYDEGLAHAREAANLIEEENFSEACTEAVAAMQKFEETLQLLENVSPASPTEAEIVAEETISLKANITRTTEQLQRIENLTTKASEAGYNTTAIQKRIREINTYLENATQQLRNRNLEEATKALNIAKTLLDELSQAITRLTKLVTESNTEKYLNEAQVRVSAAKQNITLSATLTAEAKQEAICALNNSEASLTSARDLIESNSVDEAIEELNEAKIWEEESTRVISPVAATPTAVAPATDSASSTSRDNVSVTQTDESVTRSNIMPTK